MEDDDSKFYSGSLIAPEDSSSNHNILSGSSSSSSSADFSYNHFNGRKQSSQTNSTKHDTSSDYEASGINYKYQTKNYNLASSSQDDEDDDDDDDDDKVDDQNEDENEDKDDESKDEDSDDESKDEDSDDADGDDNNDNDDADVDEEDNSDTKDRDMSSCWETKSNGSIEYDIQYPVNNDSINNENIKEDNDDNSNDNMQTITESLLNEKIKSIEEREKINKNKNKNKNLNTTTDNNSEINLEDNNYQNLSPNRNPIVVNKAASPQPGCSKDFDTIEKKFNESNNNNTSSITATTTTTIDDARNDADHLSHIQRDTNVILNIIGKLTFNSICNGLMHLSNEDRQRCINTLKKLSPFYVQKGVKRLRASDNCDLVSNKKVDDKIYPVETTNNKMNFPGRSYSPLPSEVEVIEYDDHEEVSYRRDTIDITSSDDESSTKKKNNKQTVPEQPAPEELKNKSTKNNASNKIHILPPITENEHPSKNKGHKGSNSSITPTKIPPAVTQELFIPEELPVLSGVQTNEILATIENRQSTSASTGVPRPMINNINSLPTRAKVPKLLINETNGSVNGTLPVQLNNIDLAAINNIPIPAPVLKSHKTTSSTTNDYNPPFYTGAVPKHPASSTSRVHINNINEPNVSVSLEQHLHNLHHVQRSRLKNQQLYLQQKQRLHKQQVALQRQEPQQPLRTRDLLQQNLIQHQKNLSLYQAIDEHIDKSHGKLKKPEVIRINDGRQQLPNEDNSKQPCQEIYIKLRAIFPNIKSTYIKRFCPENWNNTQSHDTQISQIVENLFSREHEWEYDVSRVADYDDEADDVLSVDDCYQQLIELFPNAEPGYMRNIAERYHDNDNELKSYIERSLSQPNYPTREEYLAKLKTTEEQKRYTDNFDVNHFLELFPNPKKHFENPKRKCEFIAAASEFLKNHFKRNKVKTVTLTYQACNYNLSIAARQLFNIGCDMKTTRNGQHFPTENIPLLQEMAYIKNIHLIEKHINDKIENEHKEFNTLKAKNQLLECQCCYDNECVPSKVSTCEEGHTFCNDCVIKGTDSKMGDSDTHIKCFTNCDAEFSLSTLQKILKPSKFRILLEKRQAAEVLAAGLTGLVSCPFCHFATIPPEGDKVFKCLNTDCMKQSCIICKEPNHVPYRCDEVGKADKTRKYIEEKMTEALSRVCYNCRKTFIKEEGCNKITCTCGAYMCYLCDKRVTNYDHFRGQGSNDLTRCPLYSDNDMLNYQTVKKVAEEIKKKLIAEDPTLNIDIDSMLPPKPKPKSGPHETIAGDPNLAAIHAARVLGTIK